MSRDEPRSKAGPMTERQKQIGRCLRASFSTGDDESPESRDLLIRMFAIERPKRKQ